jgi:hypothetical protein
VSPALPRAAHVPVTAPVSRPPAAAPATIALVAGAPADLAGEATYDDDTDSRKLRRSSKVPLIFGLAAAVVVGTGIFMMSSGKTEDTPPSDAPRATAATPAQPPSVVSPPEPPAPPARTESPQATAPTEPPALPARTESPPHQHEPAPSKAAIHPPPDDNAAVSRSHEAPPPIHATPHAAPPPRPPSPPPKPAPPSRPSSAIVRDVPF